MTVFRQGVVNSWSMWRYKYLRRVPAIGLWCAAFLAGLGLAWVGWGVGWLGLIVAVAFVALACFRLPAIIVVPIIIASGMLAGIWRGADFATTLHSYNSGIGQKADITGEVVDDAVYDSRGQKDFRMQNASFGATSLPGQVRVKSFTINDIRRGDLVKVSGKMQPGFGNYQAAIYYADVEVLAKNNNPIDEFRHRFAASVLSAMPEPQASLGLGFLLGIKSGLQDDLSDQLKVLSLTHIVVASGFNLTVLVRLARRAFEKRSKFQAMAAAVGLMAGFVAVAGASPSMNRAALVTGLCVWAWYYGRRISPGVLILFAAAITAAINPLYVWTDLGWWLSFLAFSGVLIVAPLLQRRIFQSRKPKILGQVVVESMAAQLTTMPLLLWVFGSFSVLAMPANMLIVPLVPIAMLLVFITGVVGLILPGIAGLVALPATGLLTFMTDIVKLLAAVPWASLPVAVSWQFMLFAYACLVAAVLLLWRRARPYLVAGSDWQ